MKLGNKVYGINFEVELLIENYVTIIYNKKVFFICFALISTNYIIKFKMIN